MPYTSSAIMVFDVLRVSHYFSEGNWVWYHRLNTLWWYWCSGILSWFINVWLSIASIQLYNLGWQSSCRNNLRVAFRMYRYIRKNPFQLKSNRWALLWCQRLPNFFSSENAGRALYMVLYCLSAGVGETWPRHFSLCQRPSQQPRSYQGWEDQKRALISRITVQMRT